MLPKILHGVRGQPLAKCHAGLRAPPHHSELIDVEVPCPRSTTKRSFAIQDHALTVAVRFLGRSVSKQLFDLRVDGELLGGQPHLAVFIVKDQKTGCEPARLRKLDDLQNFLAKRSHNDGADDHVDCARSASMSSFRLSTLRTLRVVAFRFTPSMLRLISVRPLLLSPSTISLVRRSPFVVIMRRRNPKSRMVEKILRRSG